MTKGVRIKIGDWEEYTEDMCRLIKNPKLAEKAPEDTLYLTPKEFSSIFTPEKVKLLRTIEEKKPRNVSQLVQMLKRPRVSVSRDVNCFKQLGLLDVKVSGLNRRPELVSRDFLVSI
jgi:predicted transcriptional regulator